MEQIDVVFPAAEVGDGDEGLDRAVAGTGAVSGEGGVHSGHALLYRHNGVRHRQGEVLVGVNPDLGVGVEYVAEGANPGPNIVHGQSPTGVGDVDAVGAVRLHELGLPGERGGFVHVRHHQEAGDVQAELAGVGDVLSRDVGLGAVCGYADGPHAQLERALELADGADPGEQERGQAGPVDGGRRRLDPLPVGIAAGAVGEAAAGQSVAVGHLDGVDARGVEGGDDPCDVLGSDAVAYGVHAVAECDVLQEQAACFGCRICGHRFDPCCADVAAAMVAAMFSA